MEGEDGKFEYQISTDDTKSWFDSVRACKVKKQSSFGPYTPLRKGEIQTTVRVNDCKLEHLVELVIKRVTE